MWDRRSFLSRGGLGVLGLAGTSLAFPGDNDKERPVDVRDRIPDGSASRGMITPKTEAAIRRGLSYLSARRESNGLGTAIPQVNRGRHAGPGPMRDPAGIDPTAAVV